MNNSGSPKILVFDTTSFPFGKLEPLINDELNVISAEYSEVYLICNSAIRERQTEQTPENVKVLLYPEAPKSQNWKALKYLFHKEFLAEFAFIPKNLKWKQKITCLKIALISLLRGKRYQKFIEELLKPRKGNFTFYSYWCEDNVIGYAFLKKRYPQYRAISRIHAYDLYFERHQPAYLPFRNLIAQHLDALLTISEQGKNYFLNHVGGYEHKIKVCRLGVKNDYPYLPKTLDRSEIQLVSCSNVIPLKRIHLIIEALALAPENYQIHWHHFGSGNFFESMRELAHQKLGKQTGIKYTFHGFKDQSEIMEFYRQNNIALFINVSETEGVPISIMEAFSFGIPAIATKVGGVSEIVSDKNGFLLPANPKPSEIWNKINYFLVKEVTEQQEIQLCAYLTWENHFNAKKNSSELLTHLNKK